METEPTVVSFEIKTGQIWRMPSGPEQWEVEKIEVTERGHTMVHLRRYDTTTVDSLDLVRNYRKVR